MNDDLRRRLTDQVSARLAAPAAHDGGPAEMSAADWRLYGAHLIAEALQGYARHCLASGEPVLSPAAEQELAQAVHDELFGLGRLERLLADPAIENINANGAEVVWVRYADGRRQQVEAIADSDDALVERLRSAAARLGPSERRFDLGSPGLSLQLPDGSRLFAVMAVTRRPCVSVRRHRHLRLTLADLVAIGTVDAALAELLAAAVRAGKNILVSGGTGAGKTTLLRALAAEIDPDERLVTIEESLELGLDRIGDQHRDVVAMQAREANVEGQGEVSQAELVRWALRMSPDRIIVGEVRGAEVLPMLNAMSTGNDGSMATVHAASSRGVFGKLAAYAVQAPEHLPLEATNLLVANAIDFVVHLVYDRTTGRRVVSSVREVIDADGPLVSSNEVFRPGPDGAAVPGVPLRDETMDALVAAGLDPSVWDRPEGWGR